MDRGLHTALYKVDRNVCIKPGERKKLNILYYLTIHTHTHTQALKGNIIWGVGALGRRQNLKSFILFVGVSFNGFEGMR